MTEHSEEHYTPLRITKGIRDDLGDIIKKEEFDVLSREMSFLKKDLGKLISKEELMTRLNVFNSDVNAKLNERPTILYFKKALGTYDLKIDSFN